MKTSTILNVALAIVVVILLAKIAFFSNSNASQEDAAMENIMTRTSIRAYQEQPVEDEKIEKMLRAAMAAPTAGNKQPWTFVVIKDKNILKKISANFRTMRMAEKAPLAVVVCGDMNKTFPGDGLDYWVEDVSAATENLLLAAHSMGLGTVWCGIYPMQERVAFLKKLLQLPNDIVPMNVVPIGYPAEEPEPKDKWKPGNIHYDTWLNQAPATTTTEKKQMTWRKINPSELRENPFTLFKDAAALSVGTQDKMNSMTIGWGGLGILWGKDVAMVYVEQTRFTHSFMEEGEYFTITAFTKDYKNVLKYLGTVSGRDEDKIKGSGLTVKFMESGCPAFEEGRLILECKKVYGAPFNREGFGEFAKERYKDRPLHSIYTGEIVSAWIKE